MEYASSPSRYHPQIETNAIRVANLSVRAQHRKETC
jgi:hypothetical protein